MLASMKIFEIHLRLITLTTSQDSTVGSTVDLAGTPSGIVLYC